MNDKIKQLAKQSAIWYVTPREDLLEDFAKLIIQETLMAARVGMEYGPSIDDAVYWYFGIALDNDMNTAENHINDPKT